MVSITYCNSETLCFIVSRIPDDGRSPKTKQLSVTHVQRGWNRVNKSKTESRMNSYIFWDITPCSSLKVGQTFGGICSLHLQGRSINRARNQHEAGRKQNFKGLHGVMSQNTEFFLSTAVRTPNPTGRSNIFATTVFYHTRSVGESKESISDTCSINCKNFRWKYPITMKTLLYYIEPIQYNSSPFIEFM
jgi:hypothetical protein